METIKEDISTLTSTACKTGKPPLPEERRSTTMQNPFFLRRRDERDEGFLRQL
jgi:hypothetical protein